MKNKNAALVAFAWAVLSAAPALAADNGQQLFQRYCSVCHSTTPDQNKVGPSLAGVVGRPSGSISDFDYSDAMQAAHLTWDEATLDKYLTSPSALVPGNKMLFQGVNNADQRKAIIAYLKTLKS